MSLFVGDILIYSQTWEKDVSCLPGAAAVTQAPAVCESRVVCFSPDYSVCPGVCHLTVQIEVDPEKVTAVLNSSRWGPQMWGPPCSVCYLPALLGWQQGPSLCLRLPDTPIHCAQPRCGGLGVSAYETCIGGVEALSGRERAPFPSLNRSQEFGLYLWGQEAKLQAGWLSLVLHPI